MMDMHIQSTHAVDIHDSHIPDPDDTSSSIPSDELNKNLPLSCFHWVLVLMMRFIKPVFYCFHLFLKGILFGIMYIILCFISIFILVFILCFVGTLASLTFPFVLGLWLVLRFSQFFKQGEDYDKVTQVKMFIEWYMIIYGVLLLFAFGEFCKFSPGTRLEHITIIGKPLLLWGNIIFSKILWLFGVRFILFWIIHKYLPRMILEHNESGLKVIQTVCGIIDCLLFMRSEFVIFKPLPQAQHKFLGLPIGKWFMVPICVIIGWNIVALLTHLIVWSIHKLVSWYLDRVHDKSERSHRYLLMERLLSVQCLVYYSNGMKRSFNFMLNSLLLLLVWVLYYVSHLKTDPKAKTLRDFGTWTCAVLFILSFFWVLKDFVLLSWEANTVYERLSLRIKEARKAFYFLGLLGRHIADILKLRYMVADQGAQIFVAKHLARVDAHYQDKMDEDDYEMARMTGGHSNQPKAKLSYKKRARVKRDLLLPEDDDTMTLFNIQQVAQYFLNAADAFYETNTSVILRYLNSHSDYRVLPELVLKNMIVGNHSEKNDELKNLRESAEQDWSHFKRLLGLDSSICVSHETMKTWLERSHNQCLFLANTLRSVKEVVDCLNNIISILLICASFILWLLFTGLASTEALVLIASPLFAATFVFGDTCKALFQGIIFVYVAHPFDVGDLCVVDGRMMEVKSVGVWKTTFSNFEKVGTREEVIYPNSELATKTIINHKTEFDWNDSVEFDVAHLDNQRIMKLKTQIERLLEEDESMCDSHNVAVLSSSEDTKINVRFKHSKHHEGMTNYECVKEKDNLRSAFILDIQELVDKEGGR